MIVFQCLAYNWTWYPVFLQCCLFLKVLLGLLQVSRISSGQLFDCWQTVQVQLQRLHRDLPALFDFTICFGLQGDLKGRKNQFFKDFLALENSSTILKGVILKKLHHIVTWVVKNAPPAEAIQTHSSWPPSKFLRWISELGSEEYQPLPLCSACSSWCRLRNKKKWNSPKTAWNLLLFHIAMPNHAKHIPTG